MKEKRIFQSRRCGSQGGSQQCVATGRHGAVAVMRESIVRVAAGGLQSSRNERLWPQREQTNLGSEWTTFSYLHFVGWCAIESTRPT